MNMKMLAAASAAALGLSMVASSAGAVIVVDNLVANDLNGTTLAANSQTMLYDFDSIFSGSFGGNVVNITPDPITNSAPPPFSGGVTVVGSPVKVDATKYASVQAGGTSTYTVAPGFYLTSFSFYLGSPDTYNKVTFNSANGGTQTFQGEDIWGGTPAGTGDRTLGYRVYYDFGDAKISSIVFESSRDAFEFDSLAGTLTAVPEPGTWALMIMGFGGAGAMIRRRKAALA